MTGNVWRTASQGSVCRGPQASRGEIGRERAPSERVRQGASYLSHVVRTEVNGHGESAVEYSFGTPLIT
jgi:hypothetical protein